MGFDFDDDSWDPDQAAASLSMESVVHTSETSEDMAQRLLREALPSAVMSATHLAVHSTNERTRLAAAQYVIDRVLGRVDTNPMGGKGAEDPLKALLGSFVLDVENAANEKK